MNEEELFDKYLSATMTGEDREELKNLLKTDESAGERFRNHVEETALYVAVAEDLQLRQTYEAKTGSERKTVRITKSRITQTNLKIDEKAPRKLGPYITCLLYTSPSPRD